MDIKQKKMKTLRKGQARLDVWMKKETKKQIKAKAKKMDLTVAEYVRDVLKKDLSTTV